MSETEASTKQERLERLVALQAQMEGLGEVLKQAREGCSDWPFEKPGRWYRCALQLGAAIDLLWIVERTLADDLLEVIG